MSAKRAEAEANAERTLGSLGSIPGFDANPKLQLWFARWLTEEGNWMRLWPLNELLGSDWNRAYDGMTFVVSLLGSKLPFLTTCEQGRVMDGFARRFGLCTTRKKLLFELEQSLTIGDLRGEDRAAYLASPWCNARAVQKHICQQVGEDMAAKLYPNESDGNQRLDLETVISEFCSWTHYFPPAVEPLRGLTLIVPAAPRRQRAAEPLVIAIKKLCADYHGTKLLADFIVWTLKPEQ